MKKSIVLREIKTDELNILKEFLFYAIYIPARQGPYSKEVIYIPEAYIFIRDFGKHKHDFCLVAEDGGKIAGVAWSRMETTEVKNIGRPDADMPEIIVSVLPDKRGVGIGTRLIREMLCRLREKGYSGTTLSVCKTNRAYRLYKRLGLIISSENQDEYIMDYKFLI